MRIIHGTDGDDTLRDASNQRTIIETRGGNDTLIFDDFAVDLVRDFSARSDVIAVDWAAYVSPFLATKTPPPEIVEFYKGGRGAADEAGFIYNKYNGKVFVDIDGDGGYNAILVCRTAPGLHLSEDNFMYV